jgi:hypothetical protein
MHLLVVLALQGFAGLAATSAEDSALARKAIAQASAELPALQEQHAADDVAGRLLEQVLIWGTLKDAWEFAERTDRVTGNGWLGARLIGHRYQRGDTADVERRLAQMDPAWRARIIAGLPSTAGRSAQPIVDRWRDPAQEEPLARARELSNDGMQALFAGDTTRARTLLIAAIDSAQAFPASERHPFISDVMESLLRVRHPIPLGSYVAARIEEKLNPWYARFQAAIHFRDVGRGSETRAMLDSMAAAMPPELIDQHRYRFMELLHLARATARDSGLARIWGDSLRAVQRALSADPDMRRAELMQRVHAATGGTPRELSVVLAEVIEAGGVRAADLRVMAEHLARSPAGASDSAAARVHAMLEVLWNGARRLPPAQRDSLREGVARAWLDLDLEHALELAERIETTASRDRAVGHVAVQLTALDAERAADLAETLRHPDARNLAYRALTERAVAGGRLRTAARFAERTASGEARVAAHAAVAQAELEAHREAAARARLRALLPAISGEEAPDTHFIPMPPGSRPKGIVWRVQSIAIRAAIRAGLSDDLQVWAVSRETAPGRATAWVTIAESLAAEKLNWYRSVPVS